MTTTTAAQAVNIESRTDFANELMNEKIPKATPVFRTYVMLKKPSITKIDSLSSNRFWISSLVQRSSMSTATTNSPYSNQPWNLSNLPITINVDYIRQGWRGTMPYGILNLHFSTEV